jgi:hypothetical protein
VTPGGINPAGLAVLLPVLGGQEQTLGARLEALPDGDESPFATLSSTHFARLVLVPGLRDGADRVVPGVPALLFFSAEFDLRVSGYLEALCALMPSDVDEIFELCQGYPGVASPRRFKRWLLDHRVRPGFSIQGNPGATAAGVVESLALRDRIIEFAVKTQGLEPQALLEAWRERDWGSGG